MHKMLRMRDFFLQNIQLGFEITSHSLSGQGFLMRHVLDLFKRQAHVLQGLNPLQTFQVAKRVFTRDPGEMLLRRQEPDLFVIS